jgi:hypothetical protein
MHRSSLILGRRPPPFPPKSILILKRTYLEGRGEGREEQSKLTLLDYFIFEF